MDVYKKYEAPSAPGTFLKFEDAKPVKIRIMSEPYIFNSVFTDKVTGESNISTKYAWLVFNYDGDQGQIMQLPITGFRQIQALAADDEWGDPTSYNLTITRTGTGTSTKYSVIGSPNKTPITTEQETAVSGISVPDKIEGAIPLAQVVEGKEVPAPSETESLPIDEPPVEDRDEPKEINLDDIPF